MEMVQDLLKSAGRRLNNSGRHPALHDSGRRHCSNPEEIGIAEGTIKPREYTPEESAARGESRRTARMVQQEQRQLAK